MMMRKRESWIDAWKGILILSVVAGHVAGGGCHLATGCACETLRMVYFLIYAFHMPAFFFLAGWMWRDQPLWALASKRFVRLMIPYFVVGVISIFLFALVGGNRVMDAAFTSTYYQGLNENNGVIVQNLLSLIQGGGWPNGQGFRYNTVLWFLPCMFVTLLADGGLKLLVKGRAAILVVGVLLFVGGLVMQGRGVGAWPWCLDRVPYYLLFVALGETLRGVWRNGVPRMRMPLLVSLLVLYGLAVWQVGYCYAIHTWLVHPARFAITLCGIYLSMVLAQAVKGRVQTWLCAAGVCSMTIMLWHKFVVIAAQVKVPFVSAMYRSGLLGSALATVLVTFGATVGCCFFAKIWDVVVLKVKRRMSRAS